MKDRDWNGLGRQNHIWCYFTSIWLKEQEVIDLMRIEIDQQVL
jgi:hypothetical protein